ncbi:NACHT domain-containing protein [Streptomyces sp. ID05-26A]|nr:NACHT domain-containing protein [Streptomyces sp. ID05-26A]
MKKRDWVPAALALTVSALAAAYFAPLGDWVAANPLPGQEWMKNHTGTAMVTFALVLLAAGALAWQQREHASPPSRQAFDPGADGHLDDLRKRMKAIWIDQFLTRSLERIVPAKLGFAERHDAITSPLRVIGTPDLNAGIAGIFADPNTARRLLVLGAPGSGKTTQLLRLADHLLSDPEGLVPIVVPLSGSSWRVESPRTPALSWIRRETGLDQDELIVARTVKWLAFEIGRLYQLPPAHVEHWLWADRSPVVLLLDGLDEIRDARDRGRCLEALSLLRSRLNTGLVVCSRTTEYFEANRKLAFGVAAEIMSLSPKDVDGYLVDAGAELASLRTACQRNPALATLLDTPLTLTVAVLTYRGKLVDQEAVRELTANQLDHLWSAYLREVLPRKRSLTSTVTYNYEDTLHYARSLAVLLERAGRDTFRMDALSLAWVDRQRRAWPGIAVFNVGFTALLSAIATSLAWQKIGAAGLVVSLLGAIVYIALHNNDTDFMSIHWTLDWTSAGKIAASMTATGLTIGMIVGAVGDAVGWFDGFHALLVGQFAGIVGGLMAAILVLPDQAVDQPLVLGREVSATRRTLQVRLTSCLVSLLPLIALLSVDHLTEPSLKPEGMSLVIGTALGVWLPGIAMSLQGWWSYRTALRLIRRDGMLPRDMASFLAHTEERIITRRRLDGHAFLHRTLQSHLAAQSSEARTARHAK